MKRILITMTSITYAMKAKKLLNSQGIYCEIERTPKNMGAGCGYSIRVKDPQRAAARLDEYGIPYKKIIEM